MNWRDTTKRRKGDKATPATEWRLAVTDDLAIVIYHPLGNQAIWALHCYEMQLDGVKLQSSDAAKAQEEALTVVAQKINRWHSAMRKLI